MKWICDCCTVQKNQLTDICRPWRLNDRHNESHTVAEVTGFSFQHDQLISIFPTWKSWAKSEEIFSRLFSSWSNRCQPEEYRIESMSEFRHCFWSALLHSLYSRLWNIPIQYVNDSRTTRQTAAHGENGSWSGHRRVRDQWRCRSLSDVRCDESERESSSWCLFVRLRKAICHPTTQYSSDHERSRRDCTSPIGYRQNSDVLHLHATETWPKYSGNPSVGSLTNQRTRSTNPKSRSRFGRFHERSMPCLYRWNKYRWRYEKTRLRTTHRQWHTGKSDWHDRSTFVT